MVAGEGDINPYLQQEVMTASPARLRWLLIRRSEELCGMVATMWEMGQYELSKQWMIRIREIIGELLEGVKDESNPVSTPISDFYLYLLKLSLEVEGTQDRQRLKVLKDLLAIESETWRLVIEKVGAESQTASASSIFPALPSSSESVGGSFSLEV